MWILLALGVILGGIIFHLRERRTRVACTLKPTVRALQVSMLATQALGVQFYLRDGASYAFGFVLVGVVGLGVLSLFCDCRNADLTGL